MTQQRRWTNILLAFSLFCGMAPAQVERPEDVIGTWHGRSTCTVRPSACHDENVIYEFSMSAPGKLTWKADKVVGGKRENMGVLDCTYEDKTVSCAFERGVWTLHIDGAKMTGTLRLSDGTLFRTVDAKRN